MPFLLSEFPLTQTSHQCYTHRKIKRMHSVLAKCIFGMKEKCSGNFTKGRYVSYLGGGGWFGVLKKFFWEQSCGPPTSQNGLMHNPSQILENRQGCARNRKWEMHLWWMWCHGWFCLRKHHFVCPPPCVLWCPLKDSKKVFLGLCNWHPHLQIYLAVNCCLTS